MDPNMLKLEIEEAFAEVEYPGDENLTDHPGCPECAEIAAYFRGRDWRDHPVGEMRAHASALSLFTPVAWHYFLPAFLLADVDDPDTADIISDSIFFDFKSHSCVSRDWYEDRHARLTPQQASVVARYLTYMGARDGVAAEDLRLALNCLAGLQGEDG
jgi:hypothetical protein